MSGPMGLVLPQIGGSQNTWGSILATVFQLLEAHDHSSGKGNLVPSAGLGINGDVSWASYALTAAKAVAFTEVAASSITSYSAALYVDSSTHDLFFRNSSGTDVRLTSGSTIDGSSLGAIGGDYATVGALLSYDDATHRYLFQQEGTPRPWAGAAMGNLDIYQQAASISNHVTIKSPSALGASYSMTLPTGLPVANAPLYVDQTGQISNTPRAMTKIIPASVGQVNPGISGAAVFDTPGEWSLGTSSNLEPVIYPIVLDANAVITGYSVYAHKGTDNTKTMTVKLCSAVRNVETVHDTQTNSANNPGDVVFTGTGLSVSVADGNQYYLAVFGSGAVGEYCHHVDLAYTEAAH